jgi:urea-proton symporter
VRLFGILAIEVKRRARKAHTVGEVVLARWGKPAHITFIFFCFLTNITITSMRLLGGAAAVNALLGVIMYTALLAVNLASFLIPWGVIMYTAAGVLKAMFLASYIHPAIIFLVLVICVYTVYVKDSSADVTYNLLQTVFNYSTTECKLIFKDSSGISFFKASKYSCGPVPDNKDGSYLTMLSGGRPEVRHRQHREKLRHGLR